MILFIPIILKELSIKGRGFPWPRMERCPRCGADTLWGHGYVMALFDGFDRPLLLKRYRCPNCRCVMRVRPLGYLARFQSPIVVIRKSMATKEEKGRWLSGLSRTRQGHWWRALKRRMAAFLGNTFQGTMVDGFNCLQALGQAPVCRSI